MSGETQAVCEGTQRRTELRARVAHAQAELARVKGKGRHTETIGWEGVLVSARDELARLDTDWESQEQQRQRALRSMPTNKRLHYLGHMAGYNLEMVADDEVEQLVLGLPEVLDEHSVVVARLLQSLMQARGDMELASPLEDGATGQPEDECKLCRERPP